MAQVIISMDEYNEMLYKDERIAELEETVEQYQAVLKENKMKSISETFVDMRNIFQNAIKENGISKEEVERSVNETKTKSNR